MSDGFGYGGSYTPYDQQQSMPSMGSPVDAVSGGPDMFQFGQGGKANRFAAGGFDPNATSKFTQGAINTGNGWSSDLSRDIERGIRTGGPGQGSFGAAAFIDPHSNLKKRLDIKRGILDREGELSNIYIGGGMGPRRQTAEENILEKTKGLSYDKLKTFGSAADLNKLFSTSAQNLANSYSSDYYGARDKGTYNLAGSYAENLAAGQGNLNKAYQSLSSQMSKYFML